MTRVMYGKIGRSLLLDPAKFGPVGGDNEPLELLLTLARRHPTVEWVLGARYSRGDADLPLNITLPELPKMKSRNRYKDGERHHDAAVEPWEPYASTLWEYYRDADGVVLWAGQQGTSNIPIPKVEDRSLTTEPQDAFMSYCAPATINVNRWREEDPLGREEIWLCPDPRNYLKSRELKWPPRHPVLSQYEQAREQRHERYDDGRDPTACGFDARWDNGTWIAPHRYTYDALEITGIPADWTLARGHDHGDRHPFGILINEARAYVGLDRKSAVRDWVLPLIAPGDIAGKWSPASAVELGLAPEPIHHRAIPDFLGRYCSTFTTPSSGSRWATTKPHEAFRLGVICFFHPEYDKQGHIIPTPEQVAAGLVDHDPALRDLATWLRPPTPEALASRVAAVAADRATYEWLRDAQLRVEARFIRDERCVRTIEARLGLPSPPRPGDTITSCTESS